MYQSPIQLVPCCFTCNLSLSLVPEPHYDLHRFPPSLLNQSKLRLILDGSLVQIINKPSACGINKRNLRIHSSQPHLSHLILMQIYHRSVSPTFPSCFLLIPQSITSDGTHPGSKSCYFYYYHPLRLLRFWIDVIHKYNEFKRISSGLHYKVFHVFVGNLQKMAFKCSVKWSVKNEPVCLLDSKKGKTIWVRL